MILCTGGCGKIFPFTTNANIKNGDGMALAYRAGAPLEGHGVRPVSPHGAARQTGILITEAARAEGGWLVNKDGYRYLQDYDLGTPDAETGAAVDGARARGIACPRLSSRSSGAKGLRSRGRTAHYVHLDIRQIGEQVIDKKLPFVRELCLKYANLDPVRELIPVATGRPLHHGRRAYGHRRALRRSTGLYAAGEVGVREPQRRQSPGVQLVDRVPRVRRPRRAGRPPTFAASGTEPAGCDRWSAQVRDEERRLSDGLLRTSPDGTERIAEPARSEMQT